MELDLSGLLLADVKATITLPHMIPRDTDFDASVDRVIITITATVFDRETRAPRNFSQRETLDLVSWRALDYQNQLEIVREAVERFVVHEAMEQLLVNGVREFDPHRMEGQQPMTQTRELHEHKINPANDLIQITADEPNPKNGNASHVYFLSYPAPPGSNAPPDAPEGAPAMVRTVISFQDGPINEVGVNGITNEALIVLVIDRLRGFQSSPFSCRENAVMLTKLEEVPREDAEPQPVRIFGAGISFDHTGLPVMSNANSPAYPR